MRAGSKMRYLLQLHLTESCNLKCKHCYQTFKDCRLLSVEEVRQIMEQADELKRENGFDELKVNLTGGEPLIIPNIKEYIEVVLEKADKLLLMTNGTMIDEKLASYLSFKNIAVQISIDGVRETHDFIRGEGSYDKAMRGIKLLTDKNVRVVVGCTIHKDNFREVMEVVKNVKDAKIKKIWFDRYIPCGNAQPLNDDEFLEAMTYLAGAKSYESKDFEVGTSRALQFLFTASIPYKCTALTKSMTVLPDGTVYPCRRMPILLGNCFEQRLKELFKHPLRMVLERPPHKCKDCYKSKSCKGGLRCLTYAVNGSLDEADPNCFLTGEKNGNCKR